MPRVTVYCSQILILQAFWAKGFQDDVSNGVTCSSITVVAVMDAK
jgi:hypothetical protein